MTWANHCVSIDSFCLGIHRGVHGAARNFHLLSFELDNDADGVADPRKLSGANYG